MIVEKTITLPLPNKILSPNARPNRYAKAEVTRQARESAKRETYMAKESWGLPYGTYFVVSLKYIPYWKTKTKKDDVNLMASCKAYEDGIQDALDQDDSDWQLEKVEHRFDKSNPRLEIIIKIHLL